MQGRDNERTLRNEKHNIENFDFEYISINDLNQIGHYWVFLW